MKKGMTLCVHEVGVGDIYYEVSHTINDRETCGYICKECLQNGKAPMVMVDGVSGAVVELQHIKRMVFA